MFEEVWFHGLLVSLKVNGLKEGIKSSEVKVIVVFICLEGDNNGTVTSKIDEVYALDLGRFYTFLKSINF